MKLHILTSFSRYEYKEFWEKNVTKLDVIWHPIIHEDIEFKGDNIQSFRVPNDGWKGVDPCYWKYNMFLISGEVIHEDRYCFLNDDDWLDEDLPEQIKDMNDPVIFVSMLRGHNKIEGGHPTSTLYAFNGMYAGITGIEQYFPTGKVCRQIRFRTDSDLNKHRPPNRIGSADGHLAEYLQTHFHCVFMPDLFVYFNYLEKGRWDK